MIASTRPRSVPRAMLATVRKIVSIRPRRMVSWVKYLATTPHLKLGLVETEIRMPKAKQAAYDPGDVLKGTSTPEPWFECWVHRAHCGFTSCDQ